MARDEVQYNNLLVLRQAIVEKTAAERKKAESSKWLKDNAFKLEDPSKRKAIRACQDKLVEKFEAPYLQKADKKDRFWATIRYIIKVILYLILVVAVLGGGGYGLYRLIKWSWNTSITKLVTEGFRLRLGCIGTIISQESFLFEEAVMVYFASYALILGIVFLIAREMDKKLIMVICFILAILPVIYGYILVFRDIFNEETTWLLILEVPLAVVMLPILLVIYGIKPLLFTAPVLVAVIAYIAVLVFCVMGFFMIEWKRDYTKMTISSFERNKFLSSQQYKDAIELDELLTEKDKESYTLYYTKEQDIYKKRRENQEKAIRDYDAIIAKCNNTIRCSTFIHNDYKTIKNLSTIIYYIEHNRADNINEAINLYIQDQQVMQIIDRLDNIQKTQLQMMNKVIQETERRFNSLEATIQKEVAKVNAAIEAQEKSLKESLRQIEESNNANATYIAQVTRNAANSISSSLNYNLGSIRSDVEYMRLYG